MTDPAYPSLLDGWVPHKLDAAKPDWQCQWVYTGNQEYTHPFFSDTISACMQLPENSSRYRIMAGTSLLPEWAAQLDSVPPALFIFHVSRCGSTLLSQLLAQDPASIVLSEVPFLDALLRAGRLQQREEEMLPLYAAALRFYGVKKNNAQQRLVIKTDSWHIHFYRELRQLFPHTPFVLLYRNPAEVIRSQQKQRGMQAVPAVIEPAVFGFDDSVLQMTDLDAYMAKVLCSYYSAFIRVTATDPLALPLNYRSGILPIAEQIAAFSGISIPGDVLSKMKERIQYHGKYPEQVFSEADLQESCPAYLEEATSLYQQLDSLQA